MRYVPLAGLVALMLSAVAFRSWLHRRRHGSWGIALFRSGDATQTLREWALLVVLAVMAAQAVVWAGRPELISWRMLVQPLDRTGILMLFVGMVLTLRAQLDLGASWRVGIERGAAPGLVTTGLYTQSRNPIFLGMLTALAGVTVLLPTPVSFIGFAASTFAIREQVIAEERWLRRTYGDGYLAYASRVGRFLPGLGRLRR